jgi:endonuclease/exonuclease/phosphatase family metal-dependent hydrolase
MPSIIEPDTPKPAWDELTVASQLDSTQLDNIKAQLDLVLLALEALANVGSDAILQAAATLDLTSIVADRVSLWRLRQSSPLRRGQGRKRLDVEEARALVLIICHLAKQHQELIRRAVALLEQLTEQNREPHQAALLGDFLDTFSNTYQERMEDGESTSPDQLTNLALKLLIDLLFYSAPNGSRRLWLALLDRSMRS